MSLGSSSLGLLHFAKPEFYTRGQPPSPSSQTLATTGLPSVSESEHFRFNIYVELYRIFVTGFFFTGHNVLKVHPYHST